uniref:Uncharacterized protein n=1 Tax=Geospiza parvula TaxID=87175 RepID=A0A8U8BL73_GEOPR
MALTAPCPPPAATPARVGRPHCPPRAWDPQPCPRASLSPRSQTGSAPCSRLRSPSPVPPPPPPPLPPPSALALPPQISLKKAANGPRAEAKKEPVSRSKSGPAAKEDASLPIVTPSLLQMVRLRSVSVEPAAGAGAGAGAGAEERPAPQKPVRRSLSNRQPPPAQDAVPSKQLHHAVHLKAAALASRPSPGPEGPAGDGQLSPRSKSPASTASFIFAKSSRKLVIETASSPEAQADLKRNLVAELMNFSGQRSAAPRKPGKIPPPVAKKPSLGSGPAPSPKAPGQRRLWLLMERPEGLMASTGSGHSPLPSRRKGLAAPRAGPGLWGRALILFL